MAKKQNERQGKLIDSIVKSNASRTRKGIKDWRSALQQAENVENPKRVLLYNVYEEIIIDAHLSAEIQKRKLAITGSDFYMLDADGENDEEVRKLLATSWFKKFLDLSMDSIFWGHSLIQIELGTDNDIDNLKLYPRKHVRPEKGLVVKKQLDDDGTFYRQEQFEKLLLEIGETDDLGLLNKCTPHVLYKRFATGAWSEFTEVFGSPLRVGKTASRDTESLNKMMDMLEGMGASAYGVIDKDEEIEFVESNKTDGNIYENLMKTCNSEISKLINGAVIGEATQEGSRAKEQVGADISRQITLGDMQMLEGHVNGQLIPKLRNLGIAIPEGFVFEFERGKDTEGLFSRVKELLQYKDVDNDYILEQFSIPVTDKKQPNLPSATAKTTDDFFQ